MVPVCLCHCAWSLVPVCLCHCAEICLVLAGTAPATVRGVRNLSCQVLRRMAVKLIEDAVRAQEWGSVALCLLTMFLKLVITACCQRQITKLLERSRRKEKDPMRAVVTVPYIKRELYCHFIATIPYQSISRPGKNCLSLFTDHIKFWPKLRQTGK